MVIKERSRYVRARYGEEPEEPASLPNGLIAKKPFPDRDWDEMPGILQSREQMEQMTPDPLHRDKFGLHERLKDWDEVHAWHLWAREHNAGIPPANGIYLVSAPMGKGKTLWAAAEALLLWKYMAVPVFHNMGILFGYRLRPEEMYQFADLVPPGSVVLIDEIAAVADSYGGNSTRSRTLFSTMTSFRKQGNLCFAMTAAEASVHWQLRTNVKAIVEPNSYWPTKYGAVGKSMSGKKIMGRRPAAGSELVAPDFCYLNTFSLDAPWEGRRIIEDYRAELFGKGKDTRKNRKNWKTINMPLRGPMVYMQASKLIDTFERVPIGEQFDVNADAMRGVRQRINSGTSGQGAGALAVAGGGGSAASGVASSATVNTQHPYTELLLFTMAQSVWRQFEMAEGFRARQIPYTEFVKVFKHIAGDNVTASQDKVRKYFKDQGYKTATKNRVSVDELVATLGTPIPGIHRAFDDSMDDSIDDNIEEVSDA